VARFKEGGAAEIARVFQTSFGNVASVDLTDGVRMTFDNEEIVHLRPSGNAPEFRVYTESDNPARAAANNKRAQHLVRELTATIEASGSVS
jgi:phosphomannomutase